MNMVDSGAVGPADVERTVVRYEVSSRIHGSLTGG
jgi:hypothetical protein